MKKLPKLLEVIEFWLRNHPSWSSSSWDHISEDNPIVNDIRPYVQVGCGDYPEESGSYDGYLADISCTVNCRTKDVYEKFCQAELLAFWTINQGVDDGSETTE